MYAANPFRSSGAGTMSGMYRQVGVSSAVDQASPHRLVSMLYDGLLESIAQARGAMRNGEIEAKGRAVGRAVRIVGEGLRGGLNMNQGGALAKNLNGLYTYVEHRLTHANLHNDSAAFAECYGLIKSLQGAWADIAPDVMEGAPRRLPSA